MFSRIAIAFTFFLALAVQSAQAAVFDITFTGIVERTNAGDNSDVPNLGDFAAGDLVSGGFLLDTSLLTGGAGTSAAYAGAASKFFLTIDGVTYNSVGASNVQIHNDHMAGTSAPFRDIFFVSSTGVTGPDVGGVAPAGIQFSLGGTDAFNAGILSGVEGLTKADILGLFANDNNNGNTKLLTLADGADVRYDVTSISVSNVPLPASAVLLGAALLGLGRIARRKA